MGVIERARELRSQIEDNAGGMSDYMALQYTELFEAWSDGVAYKAGDRVRYNGTLYKVLQDHISQGDWQPDSTSSLYAKVLSPDPGVVPEWEQPDSTNPYSKGCLLYTSCCLWRYPPGQSVQSHRQPDIARSRT